ncbi:hypothetical protein VKT23_018512 [Stygiomarasmius scandens]|uniref:Cytochrome c oxidase subunit 8, mitochondrial n=1 Tax=Marasmiellus scandens TaxID=2682957 RepID=A0ABR1IRE8_9AGAR
MIGSQLATSIRTSSRFAPRLTARVQGYHSHPPIQFSGRVHTNTEHMPFNYLNKRAFTRKYIAYLGAGFALPWIAVWWTWHRPGGFKNPTDKIDWSIHHMK